MFRVLLFLIVFSWIESKSTKINVKCTSQDCQNISEKFMKWWNPHANPCEDFYEFACGSFNRSEPLPKDKKTWSNFLILQEKVETSLVDLLGKNDFKSSSGEDSISKTYEMFQSCVDTSNHRDKLGVQPLWKLIQSVGGWGLLNESSVGPQTWIEHASIIAEYGISLYFDFKIRADPYNSSTNVIYLTTPTLEFPTSLINEEFENINREFLKNTLQKRKKTIQETPFTYYLFKVASYLNDELQLNNPEDRLLEKSRDIVKLMQTFFQAGKKFRLNLALDRVTTIGEMQEWTDINFPNATNQINWLSYIKEIFKYTDVELTPDTNLYLLQSDAMKSIIETLYTVSPQTLSNFVVSRLINYYASETNSQMEKIVNEFYKNASMPINDRKKHCLHIIHQPSIGLSLASTYLYVKHFFRNDILQQVENMSNSLKSAFKELVNEANWLDDSTRIFVLKKLEALLMMLGYPDEVSSLEKLNLYYQKLKIIEKDHFRNVINLRQFSINFDYNKVGRPQNKQIWSQSPLSINAFYTSLINRLMIPIAIMQEPFFVGPYLGGFDYGRLGAIVGHEITHGFDKNGRGRNENGDPEKTWSNKSIEAFNERISCFESQYSSYIEPVTENNVNGEKTLDENAADNGGLRVAFRAFQRLREINPRFANAQLPNFESFDANQLFFLGYASTWCQSASENGLDYQMMMDTHAPNRFRVIGPLSNLKEFSESFHCPSGSPMNPKNKCILW